MFVPCQECLLRRKSLFRPFSDAELGFVAAMKIDHRTVPPKADIVREGEVGGPVFTLYEGWAARYQRLPDGSRQILDFLLPGDMIGLSSAVLGIVKHSVEAITPVTLCALDSRAMLDLFSQHPALALAILRTRVEEAQLADMRLALLGRRTAAQRIAYLMLETFDRLRQCGLANGGTTCPFPVQRRHLADAAGLSRVHLLRTLAELRSEGLAEIQNGVLVLGNVPKLTELATYVPTRATVGRRAIL